MIKPKKSFVQAHGSLLNLTPKQWDGILSAMDAYAEHYYECKAKELQHAGGNGYPLTADHFCGVCKGYIGKYGCACDS